MNKIDLIAAVAEKTDLTRAKAGEAVRVFIGSENPLFSLSGSSFANAAAARSHCGSLPFSG